MVMDIWRPRGLRQWRPFEDIEEMEREMDRMFREFERPFSRRTPREMNWAPSIDIYEKDESYHIRAELPGINMDDIEISVSGNSLMIKGERTIPKEIKDKDFWRSEVVYGSFTRTITLPEQIDPDKIDATFDNGMLEVSIPKAKESKQSKIEIKSKKAEIAGQSTLKAGKQNMQGSQEKQQGQETMKTGQESKSSQGSRR